MSEVKGHRSRGKVILLTGDHGLVGDLFDEALPLRLGDVEVEGRGQGHEECQGQHDLAHQERRGRHDDLLGGGTEVKVTERKENRGQCGRLTDGREADNK